MFEVDWNSLGRLDSFDLISFDYFDRFANVFKFMLR
jgi:hypothetical protein